MGGDAGGLKKGGTWVRGSVGAAWDRKERKGAGVSAVWVEFGEAGGQGGAQNQEQRPLCRYQKQALRQSFALAVRTLSLSSSLVVCLSFSLPPRVHSSVTFYVRAASTTGCARVWVAQRSATSVQETHGKSTQTHAKCKGASRILASFGRHYIKPMLTSSVLQGLQFEKPNENNIWSWNFCILMYKCQFYSCLTLLLLQLCKVGWRN